MGIKSTSAKQGLSLKNGVGIWAFVRTINQICVVPFLTEFQHRINFGDKYYFEVLNIGPTQSDLRMFARNVL